MNDLSGSTSATGVSVTVVDDFSETLEDLLVGECHFLAPVLRERTDGTDRAEALVLQSTNNQFLVGWLQH